MARTFGNHGQGGFVTSPGSVPAMYDYVLITPRSKQGFDETKSNYGYAAKSRLIYSNRKGLNSATSKRSKTSQKFGGNRREEVGPYM